ncbi:type 4a pilus biogenesis protein PilO [Candidatus Thiosymbion oneisti]|uniref:type 4a pilus biogenesis protein PilO n=1 Tax=Candidatus Thiosymbion oneisti TaxID=589554 RepID=UPI000B0A36E5|nr:type 4a pilus biogenesis protein PilO [Candidatus Thiosymbion oneisti]
MDLNQLTELDLEQIGEWPGLAKAMLILLLCGGIAGAWYAFDTKGQLQRLRTAEQEEMSLRHEFESKQQQAANLGAYRRQLAEMEESFSTMLRWLPNRAGVAALLADISQTGLAAGLEFESFQPADETRQDFCAELPIHIHVTGRFHELGRFISGLAALPRIVTIHDIDIGARQGEHDASGTGVLLNLKATVKTYRYLDEETAE